MKRAVWSINRFFMLLTDCRKTNGLWLQQAEMAEAHVLGQYFLRSYVALHQQYRNHCTFALFNCRPKLHLLAHVVQDLSHSPRNRLVDAVWMDENWIGEIIRLARKTHAKKTHSSTLMRYTAGQLALPLWFSNCACSQRAPLPKFPCRIESCVGGSSKLAGASVTHVHVTVHWHHVH